jgi:rhamnosyltransferase
MTPSFALAIPTYNGGELFRACAQAVRLQRVAPRRILVIDSGSSDGTRAVAAGFGFEVLCIPQAEFDHGGTRQLAADHLGDVEAVGFLTQDAILAEDRAMESLAAGLVDPRIGVAYGRQLTRPGAGRVEAFARSYSYPARERTVSMADVPVLGLSAAFCSNSFSIWRKSALASVGGFATGVCFGEDMLTAAKLLLAGWHVGYVADAKAHHSHPPSLNMEFQRSFDMGVMHARESWLEQRLGSAQGAARRYLRTQFDAFGLSPTFYRAVVLNLSKGAGYFIGRRHQRLPLAVCQAMSLNRAYWNGIDRARATNLSPQSKRNGPVPSAPIG